MSDSDLNKDQEKKGGSNGLPPRCEPDTPCEFGLSGSLSQSGFYTGKKNFRELSETQIGSSITDWSGSKLDIRQPNTFEQDEESPKYVLNAKFQQGGMGAVYQAFDRDIRRRVALKMAPEDDQRSRLRLIEEAQVTGQLEHPNIVPIHELGVNADGRLYFTMKLVEGRSLKEIIDDLKKNRGSIPSEYSRNNLLLAFMSVCHAIAFAHSRGVVHRDLKPANIMLGKYGEVLVVDWGLAKPRHSRGEKVDSSSRSVSVDKQSKKVFSDSVTSFREDTGLDITMEGMVVGTPAYMAPEQAEGRVEDVDELTDIYALGAILYEILTYERPVEGKNFNELLANIICGFIVPPEERLPELPRELSAIILKAMSKNKEDRYTSAEVVRQDIQLFLEGRSVSAKEDSAWEALVKLMKRNKIASMFAGAILSVILVSLVVNIRERKFAEEAFGKYRAEQKAREELIAKDYYERQRKWVKVFEDDFRDSAITDRWDVLYIGYKSVKGTKRWSELPPKMKIRDGQLHVWGGAPQALVLKQPVVGDCAIEFECRQDSSYLNDISCFLGGRQNSELLRLPYSGYLFQYGGYDNTRIRLNSDNGVLYQEYGSPIKQGETYRVRAERIGERLLYMVNGDTVFDQRDSEPLFGIDRDVIGLYGWKAHVAYDNVKVYEMGVPVKDDLVQVANRQLLAGNYQTAENLFKEIARTSVDSTHRNLAERGRQKAAYLVHVSSELPRYRTKVEQAYGSDIAGLEIAEDGLSLELKVADNLTSLAPIAGMPLVRLRVIGAGLLRTLDPIADLQLQSLDIQGCSRVDDLWPIANMPLSNLNISHSRVSDLAPLRALPLTRFTANLCELQSIEALRSKPLEYVAIHYNEISDIAPLEGAPLTELWAYGNDIEDLSPLSGTDLRVLLLNLNRKLSRLAPISDLNLRDLRIRDTRVSDISALAEMKLINLLADNCPIDDISALSGMQLKYLSMKDTRISSIEALAGQNIQRLSIDNTDVTDLTPLSGSNTRVLGIYGVPLTQENLNVIRSLPLRQLTIDLQNPVAEKLVRSLPDLHYTNGMRSSYVLNILDRLGSSQDLGVVADTLKAIGFTWKNRTWLPAPFRLTVENAQKFCEDLGARIAQPPNSEAMRELVQVVEKVANPGIFDLHTKFHVALERSKSGEYGYLPGGDQGKKSHWVNMLEQNYAQATGLATFDSHHLASRMAAHTGDRAYFVIEWIDDN